MLGLTLRKEFQEKRLRGTAIDLINDKNTGATQIPAQDFLAITYPTTHVLSALQGISPTNGQTLVLIGDRGQGKSHILAVLYHALTSGTATSAWLADWAQRLARPNIAQKPLRSGMCVITESLHRQSFKFLWDLLFERHPAGPYVRGKWEGQGAKKTDVPPAALIEELVSHTPVALVLDEFQTWYDGLTNTKQYPWRNWAFNFIQVLSEIARDHPEKLLLVVSVRDGQTEAYEQIHRVAPLTVDFKGPQARFDRQRLLLHRLFENRVQIAESDIKHVLAVHVAERLRLRAVPASEREKVERDFVEAWPFSPELLTLLEDQVLVATHAQETRDLIRILADLFKTRGSDQPILTAADFRLDDGASTITSLLDSVSNAHHANLREKASRNLQAVREAIPASQVPHLAAIIGSLWLRSLAIKNTIGAEPADLQIDLTKSDALDPNAFDVELRNILENSFNLHKEGSRLVFREEENPQAKLMAVAKNDKRFVNGEDVALLSSEVKYVLGSREDAAKAYRVVVLPSKWRSEPWAGAPANDLPDAWDERIPLLVVPEPPESVPALLGPWLKLHLLQKRNAVRFLLPHESTGNLFFDRDLIILARAVYLANEWKAEDTVYVGLKKRYEDELRIQLRQRFDRFAIVDTWPAQQPASATFHVESHKAIGDKIPEAIDKHIRDNLFVPEDFRALVLAIASANESVGKLVEELREPRPNGERAIPWLGETTVKEKVLRLCAEGLVAIDVRGTEQLQRGPGESEDDAWKRVRNKLGNGKHLYESILSLPLAASHTQGIQTNPPLTSEPVCVGVPGLELVPQNETGGSQVHLPHGGTDTGGGSIFTIPTHSTSLNAPATSGLNLLSTVRDTWGITTGTQVRDITLKTSSLTGDQLHKLLKSLPDGVTYELALQKEGA